MEFNKRRYNMKFAIALVAAIVLIIVGAPPVF